MSECTALIFPSIWFEGCPLTILEAFSSGTAVIASNLGAMASLIVHGYNGLHFEPLNAAALSEQLSAWKEIDTQEMEEYRRNAFTTYLSNHTAEKSRERLINIYKEQLHRVPQLILLIFLGGQLFGQTGNFG